MGAQPINFPILSRKLHENERNLTEMMKFASLALPPAWIRQCLLTLISLLFLKLSS